MRTSLLNNGPCLLLWLACVSVPHGVATEPVKPAPPKSALSDPRVVVPGYSSKNIEGWTVRVSDKLQEELTEETARALELLAVQLREVRGILPPQPLEFAQKVPLWFSPPYPGVRPTAEYHPGAGWLRDQGRRPELHQCVEFTNIAIFDREVRRMPMLVLHELAHAYHDQVLDFDNAEIKIAFERAVQAGSYEAVLRGDGTTTKAYAITNHKEYFAECSEAFFGRNDFFPFDRVELSQHDPGMERLLGKLWRVSP